MNRLEGMRAYLAGAMDRVPDGGVGWRQEIHPTLKRFGIRVLDPCDKPINYASYGEVGEENKKGVWGH